MSKQELFKTIEQITYFYEIYWTIINDWVTFYFITFVLSRVKFTLILSLVFCESPIYLLRYYILVIVFFSHKNFT